MAAPDLGIGLLAGEGVILEGNLWVEAEVGEEIDQGAVEVVEAVAMNFWRRSPYLPASLPVRQPEIPHNSCRHRSVLGRQAYVLARPSEG